MHYDESGRIVKGFSSNRKQARFIVTLALFAAQAAPAWSAQPCAACHPKETSGYEGTAMAHSLGFPRELPAGSFVHSGSQTRFSVRSSGAQMIQTIERHGFRGQDEIAYFVGSGSHAVGFLTRIDGHLFQSPISWYAARHAWDMAPGYERAVSPDFDRPVTPECLFCHAGDVRVVRGTLNSYENPPFAAPTITCERCHGPSGRHLRSPVPGSIVNPTKLPVRARDSICEQCHLSGVARIPNPGKQIADFHPGEELEDVFSVYVYDGWRDLSQRNSLKVISHAQQLALSACARLSQGKMWCGSCHDPHFTPSDARTYFRGKCLACHGAKLLASHPKPVDDCIGCHMPRRPAEDGGHTVFTDHHIARRPRPDTGGDTPRALVAWRDPPAAFVQRNLGLADVEIGRKFRSASHMRAALQLLTDCKRDFPYDPSVATGIGMVLLGMNHGAEAAGLFEQAARVEPDAASNYLNEGFAWRSAHDPEKAAKALKKALNLDPLLEAAYRELAQIYFETHNLEELRNTWQRYLRAFPQSIEAQAGVREMASQQP